MRTKDEPLMILDQYCHPTFTLDAVNGVPLARATVPISLLVTLGSKNPELLKGIIQQDRDELDDTPPSVDITWGYDIESTDVYIGPPRTFLGVMIEFSPATPEQIKESEAAYLRLPFEKEVAAEDYVTQELTNLLRTEDEVRIIAAGWKDINQFRSSAKAAIISFASR